MGSTYYAPYAVRYETSAMAATPALLGGITKQELMTDADEEHEVSAGSTRPFVANLLGMSCKGKFTTANLTAALTNLADPVSALATAGIQFIQRKMVDGVQASGSVHRIASIADGIIYPTTISCDTDGSATIDYDVLAEWDGTNNPILFAESQALPAETLTDSQRFGLGALTVGGVTFTGKLSLTIEFGISAEQIKADGDHFPKYIELTEQLTKITCRGIAPQLIADASIPLGGKACTQANSSFVLRQRGTGAAYKASTDHIEGAFAGLTYASTVYDASGNSRGECEIITLVNYDGTNAPITWDLAFSL